MVTVSSTATDLVELPKRFLTHLQNLARALVRQQAHLDSVRACLDVRQRLPMCTVPDASPDRSPNRGAWTFQGDVSLGMLARLAEAAMAARPDLLRAENLRSQAPSAVALASLVLFTTSYFVRSPEGAATGMLVVMPNDETKRKLGHHPSSDAVLPVLCQDLNASATRVVLDAMEQVAASQTWAPFLANLADRVRESMCDSLVFQWSADGAVGGPLQQHDLLLHPLEAIAGPRQEFMANVAKPPTASAGVPCFCLHYAGGSAAVFKREGSAWTTDKVGSPDASEKKHLKGKGCMIRRHSCSPRPSSGRLFQRPSR